MFAIGISVKEYQEAAHVISIYLEISVLQQIDSHRNVLITVFGYQPAGLYLQYVCQQLDGMITD